MKEQIEDCYEIVHRYAIISIAFFGMFVGFADEKTEPTPPKVGDTAPDWTLQDPEEKEHNLKKLRGKVVFLIMGNRKIRKEDDKWAEAFQKDYRENTQVTWLTSSPICGVSLGSYRNGLSEVNLRKTRRL